MKYIYHYRSKANSDKYYSGRVLKALDAQVKDELQAGITVVAKVDKEQKKLICALAICSDKDTYDKKLGTEIANRYLECHSKDNKHTFEVDLYPNNIEKLRSVHIEKIINDYLPFHTEVQRLKGPISIITREQ